MMREIPRQTIEVARQLSSGSLTRREALGRVLRSGAVLVFSGGSAVVMRPLSARGALAGHQPGLETTLESMRDTLDAALATLAARLGALQDLTATLLPRREGHPLLETLKAAEHLRKAHLDSADAVAAAAQRALADFSAGASLETPPPRGFVPPPPEQQVQAVTQALRDYRPAQAADCIVGLLVDYRRLLTELAQSSEILSRPVPRGRLMDPRIADVVQRLEPPITIGSLLAALAGLALVDPVTAIWVIILLAILALGALVFAMWALSWRSTSAVIEALRPAAENAEIPANDEFKQHVRNELAGRRPSGEKRTELINACGTEAANATAASNELRAKKWAIIQDIAQEIVPD